MRPRRGPRKLIIVTLYQLRLAKDDSGSRSAHPCLPLHPPLSGAGGQGAAPDSTVAIVAQLVRALVCGTRGRGFKSPRSPHFTSVKVILWRADQLSHRILGRR